MGSVCGSLVLSELSELQLGTYSQNNCLMWKKKTKTWQELQKEQALGCLVIMLEILGLLSLLQLGQFMKPLLSSWFCHLENGYGITCFVELLQRIDMIIHIYWVGEKCHPPIKQSLSPLHCFPLLGTHPVQTSFLSVSFYVDISTHMRTKPFFASLSVATCPLVHEILLPFFGRWSCGISSCLLIGPQYGPVSLVMGHVVCK